jgi:sirohydrochlorin cobaltochelatase
VDVTLSLDDRRALEALNFRLRTILPEEYQDTDAALEPKPMKSAGLKFDADGRVAWDEIWGSFCDLAMAGGPPHKGSLLEPGAPASIDAEPQRHAEVAAEICRGIALATDLEAQPSPSPGWVRVTCLNDAMAGWLLRAIAMENVAVRCDGARLELPAAPHFRLDKEIKNVVTVAAKTCHYWLGHMPMTQRRRVAYLFATLNESSPLIEPAWPAAAEDEGGLETPAATMAAGIERDTGLARSRHRYAGWLGLECPSVPAALWMMRALVVTNVLSRREETALFVPVNPASDPDGATVIEAITRIRRLAGH